MAIRALGRVAVLLTSATLLVSATSCGLLPGSKETAKPVLERGTLRVGVLRTVDVAPLYLARKDNLFRNAGLDVELSVLEDDEEGIRQIASGTLDITFASHVTLFKAVTAGNADLQLEGEAYQAGTNSMALVTLAKNGYDNPANTKYKSPTIAVNSKGGVGSLTTTRVLGTSGVKAEDIIFKEMKFDDMVDALTNKTVNAAWMMEPYITVAQRKIGATVLTDTARGATLDFPMSGYAANRKFAEDNPKLVAAFRSVLGAAQLLGTNHLRVQEALVEYAKIDAQTAALVSVGSFPVSLNPVRLQRVADMMEEAKLIHSRIDVQQLLPPSS